MGPQAWFSPEMCGQIYQVKKSFKMQNFNGLKASKCSNKRLVDKNKSSLLRKNYLQNCPPL